MRHLQIMSSLLLTGLLLSGCTSVDPYHRQGMWEPTGANAANLAAMVANPHDLIRGQSTHGAWAKEQVVAVDKLWNGAAASGSGGSGSAGSSGGGSAAASAPGG